MTGGFGAGRLAVPVLEGMGSLGDKEVEGVGFGLLAGGGVGGGARARMTTWFGGSGSGFGVA